MNTRTAHALVITSWLLMLVSARVLELEHNQALVGVAIAACVALAAAVLYASSSRRQAGGRARVLELLSWAAAAHTLTLSAIAVAVWSAPESALHTASALTSALAGAISWPTWLALALTSLDAAPMLSTRRVNSTAKYALLSGLVFATVIPAMALANRHDTILDLSYFRVAEPGTATRNLVESTQDKLDVHVFLRPDSGLRDDLHSYFSSLGVDARVLDQLAHPSTARALDVRHNGVIALRVTRADGSSSIRRIELGESRQRARYKLRELDALVQHALRPLVSGPRTIYVIGGHGELNWMGGATAHRSFATARELLQSKLGLHVKPLTSASGLARELPEDAAAVLLLDPTSALSSPEVDALTRYLDRGGALLLAQEPFTGPRPAHHSALDALTSKLGLRVSEGAIAQTRNIFSVTRTDQDRTNLIADTFGSHPAIQTLGRPSEQLSVLFPSAGHLQEIAAADADTTLDIDALVRSDVRGWLDLRDNLTFDEGHETRASYTIVAATRARQRPGGAPTPGWRAIVIADSTSLSDLAISRSAGNTQLLLDATNWLLEDSDLSGRTESERDVLIVHSREGEAWIFYATSVLAPLLLLGFGAWISRRRRR